jgi:putative transposase
MARWPRLAVPGMPLHITQRGNNRVPTFADDLDFAQYRLFLRGACEAEKCAVHAYALMTNHVHLLVTPANGTGAARMMQRLGRLYVRYFNRRHSRSGTLWEGRFKSALVDSSTYFLACSRYIDLNPLRAGIVRTPDAYEWSSFRRLGLGHPDPLITPHFEYVLLGHTDEHRARVYRGLCGGARAVRSLDTIRRATAGGSALGDVLFAQQMTRLFRRRVTRLSHGGNRRRMPEVESARAYGAD